MSKPKRPTQLERHLADPSAPLQKRRVLVKMLAQDTSPEAQAAIESLLTAYAANSASQVHEKKLEELNELLKQLQEGPLRGAAFLGMLPQNGFVAPSAQVILDDGSYACSVVPNEELAASLRRGDRVLLDGRGRAVLHRVPALPQTGEEAQLERTLDDGRVEVTVRGQERCVFHASQELTDALAREEIKPGASLIVNTRQGLAFGALPNADGLGHYRYLVRTAVPQINIQTDIGSPPSCIQDVVEHFRVELTDPELNRKYGVWACAMHLLAGVTGSGKTLAVQAICSELYRLMSELTGVPVDQLPPRIFRLRMPEILNYLLGESDKQLARFFQEVEQMADEPFVTPDGRAVRLPVVAVLEEVDGLSNTGNGTENDALFRRILTTALQALDSTRPELRTKPIVYLGTTNDPEHLDRAFVRRIGSTAITTFKRLRQKGFSAVLSKHLAKVPVTPANGRSESEHRRQLVSEVTDWLFSPNGSDRGLLELTFAGSTSPVVRYRRDLLTGGLIDRVVQEATRAARKEELRSGRRGGVALPLLARAFENQIGALADQITEANARHYVDVPDRTRVASLRRLPQPTLLPQELQRH